MARGLYIPCFIIIIFLAGCRSAAVHTVWKSQDLQPANVHMFLVAGILPDGDSLLRRQVEQTVCSTLRASGYQAISAMETFGLRGLSTLGQERTLITLCERGYDAVLTIALLDAGKGRHARGKDKYRLPAHYYASRVWNYDHLLFDRHRQPDGSTGRYFWEMVLFNLYHLESRSTMQSRTYAAGKQGQVSFHLAKAMMRELQKEKVLKKRAGKMDRPVVML